MTQETLAELIDAGDTLVRALDRDEIGEIEHALERFGAAVSAIRARRDQFAPELKDKVAHAFHLAESARVRLNFLADRTRRQLDRLSTACGKRRIALAYGRDGRIR